MKIAEIEQQYTKNKNLKKEDVEALLVWCSKQPHLPPISEMEAILFLHSCYYSNEQAKITIDNYYTARTLSPEFFTNRNPADKENANLHTLLYTVLPHLTHENNRVMYARLMDTNPDHYNFNNQIKCFDMNASLCLMENGTDEGFHAVSDLKGVTFGHVTKLNLMSLRKFFFFLQDCSPVRIKGFHFINIVPFMDKIMALIKPFMKKELLDVLHLHTDNLETLYPFVPKRCLPKDYGGDAPSIAELYETQKKRFSDPVHQQYFMEQEKQVVNEKLRPGKPKTSGDVFGIEGTFKKLDID